MSRVVAELIELRTNDPGRIVRLEQIEKFRDGSGYQCVITVVSIRVSCSCPFFFDDVALSVAVPMLRDLARGKEGSLTIKGQWEPDSLRIDANAMGHVRVSGELTERSGLDQRVEFAFRTDQTVLSPLANDLQRLLEA